MQKKRRKILQPRGDWKQLFSSDPVPNYFEPMAPNLPTFAENLHRAVKLPIIKLVFN